MNENMNLDPIDFLLKLFNFRLRNINLLFDYEYLQKINKDLPSIEIHEDEFNSFKFYILKNLSLNGEFIIKNPNLFGFEKYFYPGIRYEKSFCWKRFNFLGYYSGDIYKFILNYSDSCEKIVKIKDFQGLNAGKIEFNKIIYPNGLNTNINRKYSKEECIIFLYYHDLDYRDYSKLILQNILSKKGFYDLCLKKGNSFNTTLGFYKAFLIVLNKNIKGIITNNIVIEMLKQLNKLEKSYSSEFKRQPYSWPWIFGEYIKNQIRNLNVFRESLEKVP